MPLLAVLMDPISGIVAPPQTARPGLLIAAGELCAKVSDGGRWVEWRGGGRGRERGEYPARRPSLLVRQM